VYLKAIAPTLIFLGMILWPRRREIVRDVAIGWQQRRNFSFALYWGIAALYVLSGSAVAFSSLWAPKFNLDPNTAFSQTITILGLVSIVPLRIAAGAIAKPRLNAKGVLAHDRNAFHSLWMGFWVIGLLLGLLPLVLWQ